MTNVTDVDIECPCPRCVAYVQVTIRYEQNSDGGIEAVDWIGESCDCPPPGTVPLTQEVMWALAERDRKARAEDRRRTAAEQQSVREGLGGW